MKMMLSVIMITCVLVGADALSCYQCVDMDISSTSDEMNEMLDNLDLSGGLPSCDSVTSTECDNVMMDTCAAVTVEATMEQEGQSATMEMSMRSCVSTSVPESVDEDKTCEGFEAAFEAFSDSSCKLETCTTDGCNAKTMEDDSSSGAGLKISFLLAAYTAFVIFN